MLIRTCPLPIPYTLNIESYRAIRELCPTAAHCCGLFRSTCEQRGGFVVRLFDELGSSKEKPSHPKFPALAAAAKGWEGAALQ